MTNRGSIILALVSVLLVSIGLMSYGIFAIVDAGMSGNPGAMDFSWMIAGILLLILSSTFLALYVALTSKHETLDMYHEGKSDEEILDDLEQYKTRQRKSIKMEDQWICRYCGSKVYKDAEFCSECGNKL